MSAPHVEPWLSGSLTDVHPALAPLLYSFRQAMEDLEKWTEGLSEEQIWAKPLGLGSVGFQMKHIAGSCDRLLTYAAGRQLTDEQMAALNSESDPGGRREQLLEELWTTFARLEQSVRSFHLSHLYETRVVGRKKLPTTVIGLLTHTAEHMQRHVGEAIITCKVVRAST